MAFASGSISYARFRVTGRAPTAVDEAVLAALAEHTVQPPSIGAPPETQAGWCGPRHVFDTDFDPEHVVFGSTLCFGMRLDTNRVPAEIRRAYRAMAEQAHARASSTGFLNRAEKQSAREETEDRCHRELAEGRFRASKMMPIVWDVSHRLLYAPSFSDAKTTALADLFATTFDGSLQPLSSGAIAYESLSGRGLSREYEDAKPTPFTDPPSSAEAEDGRDLATPIVSWSYAGPEARDFLGNEFLIWLWRQCSAGDGMIDTPEGEVGIVMDRVLDMDCAWDVTGKQSLRADGPTRLPEAREALRHGKWPRKAGLLIASPDGEQWPLTFQADRFLLSGVKVPKPEDAAAETPRDEVERRLLSMAQLDRTMVALYDAFLRVRFGGGWSAARQEISEWIRRGRMAPTRPTPAHLPEQPVEVATHAANGVPVGV